MGLYSALAKLIVLAVIVLVSYLAVGIALEVAGSASTAMGIRQAADSEFALFSNDALLLTVAACVAFFFTFAASLALVGHAGSWYRLVVARSARYLGAALVCACGLYLVGNAAFDVPLGLGGLEPGAESVLLSAGAAALLLLLVSRTALLKAGGYLLEGTIGAMGTVRARGFASASVELRATPPFR